MRIRSVGWDSNNNNTRCFIQQFLRLGKPVHDLTIVKPIFWGPGRVGWVKQNDSLHLPPLHIRGGHSLIRGGHYSPKQKGEKEVLFIEAEILHWDRVSHRFNTKNGGKRALGFNQIRLSPILKPKEGFFQFSSSSSCPNWKTLGFSINRIN